MPPRLEALACAAGLSREAVHSQIAAALDVVIHLARDRADGRRRVAEICMMIRRPSGLVEAEPALTFAPDGQMSPGPGLPALAARAPGIPASPAPRRRPYLSPRPPRSYGPSEAPRSMSPAPVTSYRDTAASEALGGSGPDIRVPALPREASPDASGSPSLSSPCSGVPASPSRQKTHLDVADRPGPGEPTSRTVPRTMSRPAS
ncbi:hypothetical protein ACWCSH_28160 [Streptosporangium sp. NPDC001682]